MSELTNFLNASYAGMPREYESVKLEVKGLWERFRPFADAQFVAEFTSGVTEKRQQRYWEMYVGAYLLDKGAKLVRRKKTIGPDIQVDLNGRTMWVEAISPGRGTGKNCVPELETLEPGKPTAAGPVPAKEMLLRLTAALEEKWRKYCGYLADGIVSPVDPFIIALECSQVGPLAFGGISGYPAALEAVFPVGLQQISASNSDPTKNSMSIQYRPSLENANTALVSTNRFLDPARAGLTGVLYSDRGETYRMNCPVHPVVLIHSKVATNPMRPFPYQVDYEFHLEEEPHGYRVVSVPQYQLWS